MVRRLHRAWAILSQALVSNLVGVESGSEVDREFTVPDEEGHVSNLVGVESGSEGRLVVVAHASDTGFQTLLVWRVVRRLTASPCGPSRLRSFKPCWCGEWFGGKRLEVIQQEKVQVSNLVGVESGSEGPSMHARQAQQRVSNLVGVESGSEAGTGGQMANVSGSFKPCWCGEWFGGIGRITSSKPKRKFQTLLVWRVVRRNLGPLRPAFGFFKVSNLVGVESGSEV